MRYSATLRATAFAALTTIIGSSAALAQTSVFGSGSTTAQITGFDGLTFTVTGCSLTVGDAASNCGNAAQMIAVSTSNGATIEFQGVGGGDLHDDGNGNQYPSWDLQFSLAVTSSGTRHDITSIQATMAGSSPGGHTSDATTTVNSYSPAFSPNLSLNLGNPTGTSTYSSSPTAPPVSMNVDLNVAAHQGYTITFGSAMFRYSPAPEPASIALVVVGLGAVGLIRRRSRMASK